MGQHWSERLQIFKPDVTIICSPNNPTGCQLPDLDLISLLETSAGLVVVDEPYFEFSGHTVAPLLREHRNLVILRIFSKAMALAGLRVRYLMTAPGLAQQVSKAVLPYNLNLVSQTVAEVVLEMYETELKPLVEQIIMERKRLYEGIKKIPGLHPVTSQANFMIVRSMLDPGFVFAELLKRDILIRDVSRYPMLRDFFRVSVGTPAENDLLLAALEEISESRKSFVLACKFFVVCRFKAKPERDAGKMVVPLAIIDYGVGNLRSLEKAFAATGCEAVVSNDPCVLRNAKRLVLPGVGAFGSCMQELRARGFEQLVRARVSEGTPLLGVCVGMQMLFEVSEEFGSHASLGLLRGRVRRFPKELLVPSSRLESATAAAHSLVARESRGWNFLLLRSFLLLRCK